MTCELSKEEVEALKWAVYFAQLGSIHNMAQWSLANAALAKLSPSAEVDEAREREMFRKHYGVIDDTNALPMYETMVQIWIDSARARAGKG